MRDTLGGLIREYEPPLRPEPPGSNKWFPEAWHVFAITAADGATRQPLPELSVAADLRASD
jgi:hypothetical protein